MKIGGRNNGRTCKEVESDCPIHRAERGRIEEATAVGERLLKIKPGYSLSYAPQDFFFMRAPEFVERYLKMLARAGIAAT
jgi:hypothetical protein